MNSRVTLSQLRVFLAAVELGNLTNAAADLEMSQSAVSHALSELERNLGARLLERGRFGARTTVLGEQIALQARIMFRAEASMLEEITASRQQLSGLIRIASLRSVATHVLPDFIQAFRVKHPQVQFEIQSGEGVANGVENAVRTARADLGFLAAPETTDLDCFEFFKDEWVALFSNTNAPKQETATWQEILEQPFLLCNEAGAPILRDYFARHQKNLIPAAQVEDDSVILSMVAHGFGVSILARLATLPLPDGVAVRLLPEQLERKIIVAVQPKLKSVVVEAFIKFLKSA